jgi:hypothetical protein
MTTDLKYTTEEQGDFQIDDFFQAAKKLCLTEPSSMANKRFFLNSN